MPLAESFAWIAENVANNTHYIITLEQDEAAVAPVRLNYKKKNVIITLRGARPVLVALGRTGSLFTLREMTLILEQNVTLQGRSDNTAALISVDVRGNLILREGAAISGNTNISTNARYGGGGVFIYNGGSFVMEGGSVSGNLAGTGGGVFSSGSFNLKGGEISDNTAHNSGGGVAIISREFRMEGGAISGNTASQMGGGVAIYSNTKFTMEGGTISGNTANYGGGVAAGVGSLFIKTAGIVYGGEAEEGLRNTALSGQGLAEIGPSGQPVRIRDLGLAESDSFDSSLEGQGWELGN
jgi:hypothetical protein